MEIFFYRFTAFPITFFFWMIWPFTTIFPFVIEMSIWFLLGGKRCSGPCWSRTCWLSDFYSRKGRIDILQFVHLFYHNSQFTRVLLKKKQFTWARFVLIPDFHINELWVWWRRPEIVYSHIWPFFGLVWCKGHRTHSSVTSCSVFCVLIYLELQCAMFWFVLWS